VSLIALSFSVHAESAIADKKLMLLFDVDQGWPSGIIEKNDMDGLDRILGILKKFTNRYDVYAIFSPLTARRETFNGALRRSVAQGVPFVLDVYTSDATALGNTFMEANSGADPKRALTIALDDLKALKSDRDLGPYFKGIRIFEVLAVDFTVSTCAAKPRVSWCDKFKKNVTTQPIFDRKIAKTLLDFAKENGMFVFWSDWLWDYHTARQQRVLQSLLRRGDYRDTVVLAYANNLPYEESRSDSTGWNRWLKTYEPMRRVVRGFGMSNQAWTCRTAVACPTQVLLDWVDRATDANVVALQFEPAFYFFELSTDILEEWHPNLAVPADRRGRLTNQMLLIARALGLDLSADYEQSRVAANDRGKATCLSFDVPSHMSADMQFNVSATFVNSGLDAWSPGGVVIEAQGQEKWNISPLPVTEGPISPGQVVHIMVRAQAPRTAGRYPLTIGLKSSSSATLGGVCDGLVSIEAK
jgi:hypothetical protein